MDPQNNQLPQQPTDSNPGGTPPPQPGQQFGPNTQPGQSPVPQPDGGYPTGTPGGQPDKKKLRLVVLLVSVLVVAILAVVSYFAFFKGSDTADDAAKKSSSRSEDKKAADMNTLQSVGLSLASAPQGYIEQPDPAEGVKQYIFKNDQESCVLMFGTVKAENLPGENLDAIVQPQLNVLREYGASIEGPDAGTALIVKSNDGESYRMPTLNFKFSHEGNVAVVHYSAVILQSGERAVINRTCDRKAGTGAVDMSRLESLDNASKGIVVTKK